ncbi:hypothetical protein ALC62_09321, partial [Cyphomyrmex costatus]
ELVGPVRPTGGEGTRGTDHREGRHPFLKKGVEAWHQVKSSVTIGCLQSVGSRGSEAEEEGGGVGGSEGGGTSMCCVLQGAERVFPSVGNGGKHGTGVGSGKGAGDTPVGAQDLPLESLWAAGLDEGMGFPQRCSYANQHTTLVASSSMSHTSPVNPDELWRERNFPHSWLWLIIVVRLVVTSSLVRLETIVIAYFTIACSCLRDFILPSDPEIYYRSRKGCVLDPPSCTLVHVDVTLCKSHPEKHLIGSPVYLFVELERSYTLSTPGGSSPVCCPPCSPPPAPAAYISSARASSRRLGAGSGLGGPTSPERDPLGRLLSLNLTLVKLWFNLIDVNESSSRTADAGMRDHKCTDHLEDIKVSRALLSSSHQYVLLLITFIALRAFLQDPSIYMARSIHECTVQHFARTIILSSWEIYRSPSKWEDHSC